MSSEAKVGLFVLISSLIFVVAFVSIANVQLRGGLVRYKTYFSFAGGIEKGTVVRFGGLKTGAVADVRPWAEDPTKIEVLLDLKAGTPVRQDSVAAISTLGMIGENYVEITPGKKDSPPLPPGSTISSQEAVDFATLTRRIGAMTQSSEALIIDLHRNLNEISAKADQLIANLNELTGEKNRQNVEALLERSNRLVADQAPKIDTLTGNLNAAVQKIDGLVADLRGTNARIGDLVSNVNKTVDETRDPIKDDLKQLQNTIAQTQDLIEQLRGTMAYNDENINRMIENFRVSSQNLKEFTAEVKQRPFSLFRIRPKPDRRVPVQGQR
jgi:phospholipid/cholesterol/gamma-HCH transport system substrate-binding protein